MCGIDYCCGQPSESGKENRTTPVQVHFSESKTTPEPEPEPVVQTKITQLRPNIKATVKKNKVIVSWNKIKKTAKTKDVLTKLKKVQVQYSTNKQFKKNIKTRSFDKDSVKATLNLKKNTVYYIRVRYVAKNGYSKWSAVKKVKTRK